MQATATMTPTCLRGVLTEADLDAAEEVFPGICELHARRGLRDRTFLELLAAYLNERPSGS